MSDERTSLSGRPAPGARAGAAADKLSSHLPAAAGTMQNAIECSALAAGCRESAIATTERKPVPDGADAHQVAEAAVATWATVHAALTPVVGARGVVALYKRALFLTGQAHPWLAEAAAGTVEAGDFSALRSALSRQDAASAAAAQQQMLHTLHELLVELIGPMLTDRLLHAVWSPTSAGKPRQDASP